MTTNPDEINDPKRQIEAKIFKEAEFFAADDKESKKRNKSRAESRDRIKDVGGNANAFQTAVRHYKSMSPSERKEWLDWYLLSLKVVSSPQSDLFAEEKIRNLKREADRKAQEKADAKEAARKTGDDNPRSDPKSGGAGEAKKAAKKTATKKPAKPSNVVKLRPTEAELTAAAANAASEQVEGGEVLSQSAQSKQKLTDAGIA